MGDKTMSINQLYGEILGNTKGVTWRQSVIINYWYMRVIDNQPIDNALAWNIVVIYQKCTMDYRHHIVRAILETY